MKRKLAMAMLACTIVLAGCGSSNTDTTSTETATDAATTEAKAEASTVEEVEPLSLVGNWMQEGKEGEDSYQAGYVSDDRIEIYWVLDGGDTTMLYWSGTYDAPTEDVSEYTWDSVNDTTRTGSALMASGDDTKTFSYADGKISYDVSIGGETATVTLVTTDTDFTSLGSAYGDASPATDLQEVQLVDSGYSAYQNGDYVYLYYAVEMTNPNEEYAIEFPTITVTAKDADGKILKTEDQTLMAIAAGDTIKYGSSVLYEGSADSVSTVEISVGNSDSNYTAQDGSGVVYFEDLSVGNVSETSDGFTGEVANVSSEDESTICISVIYTKEGKMVGGDTTFVDDVAAGESKAFELSTYSGFTDYDGYEIVALQW